ncbi:MAG: 7-cyano-7-deazaguanine synthase QueC [Muribaculaceae bacterium]|nr:7-cyano-7-deazaguanine synthase QueC [Muribaculaceae bacterium]
MFASNENKTPEKKAHEKNALLVLSGGMDSVTMLYDYADEIALTVYFHYGSNHGGREVECARYHTDKLGIPLIELPLTFMADHFRSSLLQGADAIPEGPYSGENMVSTVVPFRNGIMLAVAAGLAESRGLKRVMIANHSGDHTIYPDCRPEFIDAMGSAINKGTFSEVELYAPYTPLTKAQIACRGRDLHVDYSRTYSCYRGGQNHCGRCATCIERHEALKAAGIDIID